MGIGAGISEKKSILDTHHGGMNACKPNSFIYFLKTLVEITCKLFTIEIQVHREIPWYSTLSPPPFGIASEFHTKLYVTINARLILQHSTHSVVLFLLSFPPLFIDRLPFSTSLFVLPYWCKRKHWIVVYGGHRCVPSTNWDKKYV